MTDESNVAAYERPQSETHLPITQDVFADVPAAHLADEHSRVDAYSQVDHGHEDAQSAMQAAIDAVAEAHLGAPRETVAQALQRELESRGHWPQPRSWMAAVTDSLSDGTPYHV